MLPLVLGNCYAAWALLLFSWIHSHLYAAETLEFALFVTGLQHVLDYFKAQDRS